MLGDRSKVEKSPKKFPDAEVVSVAKEPDVVYVNDVGSLRSNCNYEGQVCGSA